MLIKIIKDFPKILAALYNLIFGNEKELSEKRLKICNTCELIDKKGKACVVPGTQPCCGVCGCSLKLLTRSVDSSCPHPNGNKW